MTELSDIIYVACFTGFLEYWGIVPPRKLDENYVFLSDEERGMLFFRGI